MNKSGKTTIYIGIFLTLVVLSTSIYIFMPKSVKLDVQPTYSNFYVWENNKWELGATEHVYLYDGSTKMLANYRNVNYTTVGDITKIIRTARWKDNITTIGTYTFDSTIEDKELFPILRDLQCINCVGKIVQFEYRDIIYSGITEFVTSPQSYGRNMKIEWQDGAYYAKVFQLSTVPDKLIIKYKPTVNDVTYSVRMFDPAATINLTLAGFNRSIIVELGSIINVTATTNETVCIDFNHPSYGINYSCSTNRTSFNANVTWFRTTTLSNGNTTQNNTFTTPNNITFNISSHQYDEPVNLSFNLTGYISGGTYPANVKMYINDTYVSTIGTTLSENLFTLSTFNDTTTIKNLIFSGESTQIIGYLDIFKTANITSNLTFNITGTNMTTSWCYQESANVSNQSGTDEGCGLNYTGSYYTSLNDSTMYLWHDGNWDTATSSGYVYYFVNYSKPLNINNNTLWRVKYGQFHLVNNVVPEVCLNQSPLQLRMWIYDFPYTQSDRLYFHCWDSTAWLLFYTKVTTLGWFTINEEAMNWSVRDRVNYYINNSWLEVGDIDGIREWNYTGEFKTSQTVVLNHTFINSILYNCTADASGFCNIPITIYSSTPGRVTINNISMNYTYEINPIIVNGSLIQSFLNTQTNTTKIPLKFTSDTNGTLQISDIKYDYIGGNKTYNVLAHDVEYTTNQSYNITYFYSDWQKRLPANTQYIEFIPTSATSKNITPYRQTPATPIINFTYTGYGNVMGNFTVNINQTDTCINWSINTVSNKTSAIQLNTTEYAILTNKSYLFNAGIWMWADYACNSSRYLVKTPKLIMKACCKDCDICDVN